MRIYYVGESRSRTLSVATALGVDAEHWNGLAERVMNWRWVLEDDFNVPTGRTLRGPDLLSSSGRPLPRGRRNPLPTLEEGLEIMMTALRLLEHSPHTRGAVSVINVCRRNSPFRRNRAQDRAARERLLELADASLAADGRYAHVIEDEEQTGELPSLARLPSRPVDAPGACVYGRGGDYGGDIHPDAGLGTGICAAPHRVAGDDELLQLAGLVSYALLQQEEPTHMAETLNFHLAFGILKRVLDRRACPQDPQGVERL